MTKSTILSTARNLFNEHGYSQVSLRKIADELDMSPGNLTYHYSKKDDIVMALQDEFVSLMNDNFGKVQKAKDDLMQLLVETTYAFYSQSWNYRFFMIDMVFFTQQYPQIKEQMDRVMLIRKDQLRGALRNLRSQQILKPEMCEGQDERLIDMIFLMGNFWISHELVMREKRSAEELISKGINDMVHIVIPYVEEAYREDILKMI